MATNDAATYFEDIEIGETQEFGEYRFTREEILEFGRKYDPQPFHADEEAAEDTIFGGLIASGWHTTAVTMKLLVENREENAATVGGSGADEVRWHQPVSPGDVIAVSAGTVEKRDAPDLPGLGHVHHDITGVDPDGQPVITWTALELVEQRDSA